MTCSGASCAPYVAIPTAFSFVSAFDVEVLGILSVRGLCMTIYHLGAPKRQRMSEKLGNDQPKGEDMAILMTSANSAVGFRSTI